MIKRFFMIAAVVLFLFFSGNSYSATYNATGIWNYSTSNTTNNCPGETSYPRTGTVIVNQNGDDVSFVVDGQLFTGTVDGVTYTVSASYPEDEGTAEETIVFSLNPGGTTGSGTGSWTYTEPGWGSCSGGYQLSIQKLQDPPTYNGTGIWYYVIEGENETGFTALTQNKDTFTYTDEFGIHAGRISGNKYISSIRYPEDDGITTQTIFVTLSNGSHGSGYLIWTWTDGTYTNSGGGNMQVTKVSTEPTWDASGRWNLTWSDDTTHPVTITQDVSTFRLSYYGDTLAGLLSGPLSTENKHYYICFTSYPYKYQTYNGTITESLYFELGSETSGTGSIDLYWTDGTYEAWGYDTFTLSKVVSENHPPNPPTLSSPANNATSVSLTPVLMTGNFSDPDTGDTHQQTEWQIGETNDFSTTVFQSTSQTSLTSLTVPAFVLEGEKIYYWRSRFFDNNDLGSGWSSVRSFTTQADYDTDNDGIRDGQANFTADLNGDGKTDYNQRNIIKSLNTAVGGGQMGASLQNDPNIISIDSVESVDPNTISQIARPSLPLGLFTAEMTVVKPTDTAKATIYFSQPAPEGAKWYMYDPIKGWVDYSELGLATFSTDRKSLTLNLMDFGHGDADGTANGTIVDPGGFGFASGIKGRVYDTSTNSDIPNAKITISDITWDMVSGGTYLCMIVPGSYSITISANDYGSKKSSIQVQEGVFETINFGLTSCRLSDAIGILQLLSGPDADTTSIDLSKDYNGDNRLGLADAIFILQTVSGSR